MIFESVHDVLAELIRVIVNYEGMEWQIIELRNLLCLAEVRALFLLAASP